MPFCLQLSCIAIVSAACLSAAGSISIPSRTVSAVPARVIAVVRTDPRTGQFVKTVNVPVRLVPSRIISTETEGLGEGVPVANVADFNVRSLVADTANQYEVSPALVDSVIQVESNYNPRAVSPKGAQGLMQLMPATARRFGVKNSFDPKDNIIGGVRYLKFLQETFKDERLAIAAYNAGEGAVQKYGNVPPYAETMSYVAKVGKKYGQARRAELNRQSAKQAADSPPKQPEHRPLAQFIDSEGRLHITTK
ncbi:MAG: lytic transglycosylase domain-containing protein [Bryobacteraceae bacterium]